MRRMKFFGDALRIVAMINLLAVVSACATTRVVQSQPRRGGVIAVKEGLIGDARKDAKALMSSNCPRGRYEIVEEGEHRVGRSTSGSGRSDTGKRGSIFSTSSSEERDVNEWRIKYRCIR